MQSIANQIRRFLRENADPLLAGRYARFIKEGYDAYGVPWDAFKRKRREILTRYKDKLGLEGFLSLGEELLSSGKYEEAEFAISFLDAFGSELAGKNLSRLGGWFEKGVRNWAHADALCRVLRLYLVQKGKVGLADFASWRESTYKWKRRAVPVTLTGFFKTLEDIKPLLSFLAPMMADTQKVVQQGLGIFMRKAWKKNPVQVEKFLLKYRDTAPRRIFSYVTPKMPAGKRESFKRRKG